MILNSLDWNDIENTLRRRSRGLAHRRDVERMINNIKSEITQLSIAEVAARRGRKSSTDDLLAKINHDIELVEEYILVATLLG